MSALCKVHSSCCALLSSSRGQGGASQLSESRVELHVHGVKDLNLSAHTEIVKPAACLIRV